MTTSPLLRAVTAHYEAKQAKALAELDIYLNRPVGVGDHANVTDEVIKLFAELDHAESVTKTVNAIIEENRKMQEQMQAQTAMQNTPTAHPPIV